MLGANNAYKPSLDGDFDLFTFWKPIAAEFCMGVARGIPL